MADDIGIPFSAHPTLNEITRFHRTAASRNNLSHRRERQAKFAADRNWDQYHTTRNLLLAYLGECGELCELFQWCADDEPLSDERRTRAGEEVSDCLIYLIRLAEMCRIDLPWHAARKMRRNRLRYRSEQFRGRRVGEKPPIASNDDEEESAQRVQTEQSFTFSDEPTLEELRAETAAWIADLNWKSFMRPRCIVLSLMSESGELCEHFRFRADDECEGLAGFSPVEQQEVGNEFADCLTNLIMMSLACDIDLPAAVARKFQMNADKYPIRLCYGSAKKYTELGDANDAHQSAGKMLVWLDVTSVAREIKLMLCGALAYFLLVVLSPFFGYYFFARTFTLKLLGFLLADTLIALHMYAFMLVLSQRRQIILANRIPASAAAAARADSAIFLPPMYAELHAVERGERADNQPTALPDEKPRVT